MSDKDSMLVFLLSFYLHYVLLNCHAMLTAKFNETLLVDHHRKNLQEVNHLLNNLVRKTKELSVVIEDEYVNDTRIEQLIYENITNSLRTDTSKKDQDRRNSERITDPPDIFGLPSMKFDTISPRPDPSPIFPGPYTPPSVIPTLSRDPGRWALRNADFNPPFPRYVLKPMYNPGMIMPPGLYPGKHPGEMFNFPYFPNSTGAMLPKSQIHRYPPVDSYYLQVLYKRPPYLDHFLHIHPQALQPYRPVFALPSAHPPLKTSPSVSIYTKSSTTLEDTTFAHHVKLWMQEIAPYTRRKKKKKKTSKHQTHPHHKRPTDPISPRVTLPTNYWFTTGTASMAQLFSENRPGFLDVSVGEHYGRPVKKWEDPQENWVTTTAGYMQLGTTKDYKPSSTASPNQRYLELMEQLHEGYLMVFVMELTRLVAVKEKRDVREVLAPVETIFTSWLESNRLYWVDDSLLAVIGKLSVMTSEGSNLDVLRCKVYSSMMFHTLLERKKQLSPEVNSIIDLAERFYGADEGKQLLRSLNQFEEYPNSTKASFWICEGLIESFLQPFRRSAEVQNRQQLLNSVSRALRQNYPLLTTDNLRGTRGDEGRPMIGIQPLKRQRKRRLPQYYNNQIYMKH